MSGVRLVDMVFQHDGSTLMIRTTLKGKDETKEMTTANDIFRLTNQREDERIPSPVDRREATRR